MRTDFGGGSVQSRVVDLVVRTTARPIIDLWSLAPRAPWPYGLADLVGVLQQVGEGTTYESIELPDCRAEVTTTPESDSGRVIVYLHGGAFVVGGRLLHRELISRIARKSRATVVAVEYRKMPRHSIAEATLDGVEGYRWALEHLAAADDIVLMGDSAGGFLTFTVAEEAMEQGLPRPAGIVAISPLIDLDYLRTPVGGGRFGCAMFGPRAFRTFATMARRQAGLAGLHTPVDCLLEDMPPVLLQTSSSESLFPQITRMAELLDRAGVPVELQVWDKQVHVFQAIRALPEAQQAVREIGAFVAAVCPRLRMVRSA